MLMMVSIVRVGQSKFSAIHIDEDSQERIMNCIETLARMQPSEAAGEVFLRDTKPAYTKMVAFEQVSPG
jgi:coatomer subunit beta